mmetsp:Transcript_74513/g.147585  ORF Transcript_74513/g.147585 Transcript_74513/m.147585 type:complete len:221 (-) Transcript_74513:546-1208(-)
MMADQTMPVGQAVGICVLQDQGRANIVAVLEILLYRLFCSRSHLLFRLAPALEGRAGAVHLRERGHHVLDLSEWMLTSITSAAGQNEHGPELLAGGLCVVRVVRQQQEISMDRSPFEKRVFQHQWHVFGIANIFRFPRPVLEAALHHVHPINLSIRAEPVLTVVSLGPTTCAVEPLLRGQVLVELVCPCRLKVQATRNEHVDVFTGHRWSERTRRHQRRD